MKYVSLMMLLFSISAAADVDVDWPYTDQKGVHVLAITIDGCQTRFKIKDEDFKAFTNSSNALDEAIDKAEQRSSSGCRN